MTLFETNRKGTEFTERRTKENTGVWELREVDSG
jgi:hypothetical protein